MDYLFVVSERLRCWSVYFVVCELVLFAAQYSRLVRLAPSGTAPFRNIQIRIMEDRFALVSKSSSPSVHFLIQNPQLVAAFSQFSLPGRE